MKITKNRKHSKAKSYKKGVIDSLRLIHTHINSMEHAVGFTNSQLASDHADIMKNLYNNISTLLNK